MVITAHYIISFSVMLGKVLHTIFFQTPEERKDLRCVFSTSNSSWLLLGPMKIQVNSHDPYDVTVKSLVHENECDDITASIGSELELWDGIKSTSKLQNWEDIRVMKKYIYVYLLPTISLSGATKYVLGYKKYILYIVLVLNLSKQGMIYTARSIVVSSICPN